MRLASHWIRNADEYPIITKINKVIFGVFGVFGSSLFKTITIEMDDFIIPNESEFITSTEMKQMYILVH